MQGSRTSHTFGNRKCGTRGMAPRAAQRIGLAAGILDEFAASSGVTSDARAERSQRRYLWTDAFAVMTWVGLYERTAEERFLALARRLVAQVHEILGKHRSDDAHPTRRGLRIGKPLPERGPDEPYDAELEWERDGQYYHYLTKWMHALERVGGATGEDRYHAWAVELAQVAHRTFTYPRDTPRSIYWKMSVDLTRPLVSSMGAHDPIDGLVAAASLGLVTETRELARICARHRWATDDTLGAGGLLVDALRLGRLVAHGRDDLRPLFSDVMADVVASTEAAATTLHGPAARRLAFRELGFSLGLHAIEPLADYADVSRLRPYEPLAVQIEDLWLDASSRSGGSWHRHGDINQASLAASLAPDGALG